MYNLAVPPFDGLIEKETVQKAAQNGYTLK